MLRVKTVIHIATEAAGAVKPWAGAYKDASVKPFGTVVAGGGAAIGCLVVIAVGALGRNTYADRNLSLCCGKQRN